MSLPTTAQARKLRSWVNFTASPLSAKTALGELSQKVLYGFEHDQD